MDRAGPNGCISARGVVEHAESGLGSTRGGLMKMGSLLRIAAVLGVLTVIAAACSNSDSGGSSGSASAGGGAVDCNAAPGCVTVGRRRAGRDRHAARHLRGQQEPRAGLSVRRPSRARLPRRHVRPEGRPDRRARHQARERGRRMLRRRRAEGRHDAGGRSPARRRHRHQLLERLARRRGQDPLGQGHRDHLALGHEPGADHARARTSRTTSAPRTTTASRRPWSPTSRCRS